MYIFTIYIYIYIINLIYMLKKKIYIYIYIYNTVPQGELSGILPNIVCTREN